MSATERSVELIGESLALKVQVRRRSSYLTLGLNLKITEVIEDMSRAPLRKGARLEGGSRWVSSRGIGREGAQFPSGPASRIELNRLGRDGGAAFR
jgi:hypothetical protein